MKKMKYSLIGILISLTIFLLFGIITALIPTNFFKRMISATIVDYVFLTLTSVMLGTFITLHFYGKQKFSSKEDYTAAGGAISSIFAFGCSICNTLLVLLFGVAGVLMYFEPLRPILGVIGVGFLGIALYLQVQNIKSRSKCSKKK